MNFDEQHRSIDDLSADEIIQREWTSSLRAQVNDAQRIVRKARPHQPPSLVEVTLGTFMEDLDPQVKDAVLMLYDKGYTTFGSGFWGEENYQTILGEFRLEDEIKQRLEAIGVDVREFEQYGIACTDLHFSSYPLSLEQMKQRWDEAAAFMPPTNAPARASRVKAIMMGDVNS